MARDKQRRETLLSQIVKRKQRNDLYKLQLPFNIWSKKVKLEKMNSGVNMQQNLSSMESGNLSNNNNNFNNAQQRQNGNALLNNIASIKTIAISHGLE